MANGVSEEKKEKSEKTTPFIDKSQLKTTARVIFFLESFFFLNPIKVIDLGDFYHCFSY